MYANTKSELFGALFDNNTDVTYSQNRLVTRETDSGNVSLIAYGWLKIAEFDSDDGTVTVFTGHKAIDSTTLSRYLNDVTRNAQDRDHDVVLSGESPTVDTPNDGVRFINNYVSMDGGHSPVEQQAVDAVVESLSDVA
jgi:hypothetical protein